MSSDATAAHAGGVYERTYSMIKRTQSTHCIKKIDEEENTFYMKTHKVNTFYIGENTLGEHILQTRNHTYRRMLQQRMPEDAHYRTQYSHMRTRYKGSACLGVQTTEHSIHTREHVTHPAHAWGCTPQKTLYTPENTLYTPYRRMLQQRMRVGKHQ